jgi:hypothetical protein
MPFVTRKPRPSGTLSPQWGEGEVRGRFLQSMEVHGKRTPPNLDVSWDHERWLRGGNACAG